MPRRALSHKQWSLWACSPTSAKQGQAVQAYLTSPAWGWSISDLSNSSLISDSRITREKNRTRDLKSALCLASNILRPYLFILPTEYRALHEYLISLSKWASNFPCKVCSSALNTSTLPFYPINTYASLTLLWSPFEKPTSQMVKIKTYMDAWL